MQIEIQEGVVFCTAPTIPEPELQALAFIVDMLERNIPDLAARRRIIKFLDAKYSEQGA